MWLTSSFFAFLGDIPGLGFIIGSLIGLGIWLYDRRVTRKAKAKIEALDAQRYYQRREKRDWLSLDELPKLPEADFWKLVNKLNTRSKGNYKGFLGLFEDYLNDLQPDELLKLYGLIQELSLKFNKHSVFAACSILARKTGPIDSDVIFSWLLSQGEVKYNNAVHSPDLMANFEIDEIPDQTMINLVAEFYEYRSNQSVPAIKGMYDLEPEGEEIEDEDLPLLFPRLWEKYMSN